MPKSVLLPLLGILAFSPVLQADPLTQAQVTKIINDVRVVDPKSGNHPATINERIHDDIGLRTGIKSRSELLFQDNTLTRIGPETQFNFTPGTRDLTLKQGTILLQVPKGIGGAKIRTAAITAALTGTTIMLKYAPGSQVKVLVLEGSLQLSLNRGGGNSVSVPAGQMVQMRPDAKRIPAPVTVDLRHVMQTSSLVKMAKKGKADLPSSHLINKEISKQDKDRSQGQLVQSDFGVTDLNTVTDLQSLRKTAVEPEAPIGFSHHN